VISDPLAKAKSLAAYFNQSAKFQRELESAQTQLNMKHKSLIQSVETRWNSAYYCICSIVENQRAIRLAAITNKKCPPLTEEDVEVLNRIIEVFRPLTEAYLKEPVIPRQENPLEYWRANTKYPNLRFLARRFLSAPPSSAESERHFSTVGSIYRPNRSKLSGEHGKMLLFLHHHM
jgi:hypothetical protein